MIKVTRKRRAVVMKATDVEEEILTQGLRLQLEDIRRKNFYFKGGQRGPAHMKMSREEKRAALRFAGYFVKAYFQILARGAGPREFVSRDAGTRA
jgi:hypothetical protein